MDIFYLHLKWNEIAVLKQSCLSPHSAIEFSYNEAQDEDCMYAKTAQFRV